MSSTLINKFVVVGVGLIGGSLAAALRQRGGCREIIGIGNNYYQLTQAKSHGVVDRAYQSLRTLGPELRRGDVIFISVPTLSVQSVLEEIKIYVSPEVTITDGASVKGSVKKAAESVFGYVPSQFILGHPIAGSERSGVAAANPNLYVNHRCILTPLPNSSSFHLNLVKMMWRAVGAQVVEMSVQEHDQVLGATSHLPHVIAYSLMDTLATDLNNPNIFKYAAGGFRDFTRIASSNPIMWNDIMLANKSDVLNALDKFIENLRRLRHSIQMELSTDMLDIFKRAKSQRDKLVVSLDKRTLSSASVKKVKPATVKAVPVKKVKPATVKAVPVKKVKPVTVKAAPVKTVKPATVKAVPVKTVKPVTVKAAPVKTVKPVTVKAAPVKTVKLVTVKPAPVKTVKPVKVKAAPVKTVRPATVKAVPIKTIKPVTVKAAPVKTVKPATVKAATVKAAPVKTVRPATVKAVQVKTVIKPASKKL